MITTWLQRKLRETAPYSFKVIDITENNQLDDLIKAYLGEQTLQQYRSLEFLKKRYESESPEDLISYLRNYVFSTTSYQIAKNVRSGDFGEILSTLVVEQLKNLTVPISKLRYKFNKDRSIFCTDLISHNKGDTIQDITYYEVKTRTSYSKQIGVKAYEGLLKDEQKPTEFIADFLDRLYLDKAETLEIAGSIEEANKYYSISKQYGDIVKNPKAYNRSFEIIIIIEATLFKEDILTELDALTLELSPLEITIILVNDLNDLVEETFTNAEEAAKRIVYNLPPPKTATV